MSDLKPCPFCGSDAKHWEASGVREVRWPEAVIKCMKCETKFEGMHLTPLVKAWNSRPGEKAARVEALERIEKILNNSIDRGELRSGVPYIEVKDIIKDKLIEAEHE